VPSDDLQHDLRDEQLGLDHEVERRGTTRPPRRCGESGRASRARSRPGRRRSR
jgi:hypothetical protein